MKNWTTEEFCRKFEACTAGMRFALKFKTMRECYAALLAGEAGEKSAAWTIWAATRKGVMSDRDLRLFAVRCARRVQHLMKDQRSIDALDVAERYANGEATEDELTAATEATWAAADAAAEAATCAVLSATWAAADAAERREQLKILAEFGNPFEED